MVNGRRPDDCHSAKLAVTCLAGVAVVAEVLADRDGVVSDASYVFTGAGSHAGVKPMLLWLLGKLASALCGDPLAQILRRVRPCLQYRRCHQVGSLDDLRTEALEHPVLHQLQHDPFAIAAPVPLLHVAMPPWGKTLVLAFRIDTAIVKGILEVVPLEIERRSGLARLDLLRLPGALTGQQRIHDREAEIGGPNLVRKSEGDLLGLVVRAAPLL
eukprot:CAMPEP_0113826842 /NCGR_PEP_ID=MMETSP0328-20130328/4464_1 /TAXON_ID=39455 /ORGANISM="Alexandrium minutum" /LENGTH=213 /DNA_ID=CAMNT_0000794821 /DNA_START=340 /DNA_END=979 /DNA_ORIENTATION=- /assembly_acc=CAM_ASM_000350